MLARKYGATSNYYIDKALTIYLEGKNAEIAKKCRDEYRLDEETIRHIQQHYKAKLHKIDFLVSYSQREFPSRRLKNGLISLPADSSDIDAKSLAQYIELVAPDLANVTNFIDLQPVVITKIKKCEMIHSVFLEKLLQIKEAINSYTAKNKKNILKDFNEKMRDLYAKATSDSFLIENSEIIQSMGELLNELQAREESYYQDFFLADYRKSNSHLQPSISHAKSMLDSLIKMEKQRLTNLALKHTPVESQVNSIWDMSDVLTKIRNIKKSINSYTGVNKKNIINDFNNEIDALYLKAALDGSLENIPDLLKSVKALLHRVQTSESNHYQGLFFASYRKSNSHLQLKINEAKNILDSVVKEENRRLMRVLCS